jgi:uncharacterized protein (TIGR00369 family)
MPARTDKDPSRYAFGHLFGPAKQNLAAHTPHCAHIGMEVVSTGPCAATIRLPFRSELIGDPSRGVVFGGVITTLIDHTAGLSVFCSLEELRAIATLDLRIDYLRAARAGADLIGHAECYKMTKNVAFVRACAYEDDPDDPFASCMATFMVGAHDSGSHMEQWESHRERNTSANETEPSK